MSAVIGNRCVNCSTLYPISAGPFICPKCGERQIGTVRVIVGLQEVVYDYSKITVTKRQLAGRTDRTIWRFREFLPVQDPKNIVSLGEGGTPLLRCPNLEALWGVKNLYVKNEAMNPTGSFKDRATSVMISMAKELGVKRLTIASSGNAGGSVAAYANAAGIEAICFVPVGFNPSGKRSAYAAFAPKALIGVHGYYEDVNEISVEMGLHHGWYMTNHGFNPYRVEGDKTTGYEICIDLGWKAPDHILVPTGSGADLVGIWKGCKEFYDKGWIRKLPKMIAVQVEAGAPVVDAVLRNKAEIEPCPDAGDSAADGVISKWDDYAPLLLKAIRESGGTAVAVSDAELLDAQRVLAKKQGIFVEPSSSVAVAGYKKLVDQGWIGRREVAVIIGTATGLKNPEIILKGFKIPFECEYAEDSVRLIERYLREQGTVG